MVHDDFAAWLQTATHGLPKSVLAIVQNEMRDHYEDAVSDYLRGGKSASEAKYAALADLGDVQETARALKQIHLAPRRYLRAGFASIAPWLLLISLVPLLIVLKYFSAIVLPFYVLSCCCTLFTLNTFPMLLPYQRLRLPITLMSVGIIGVVSGFLLSVSSLGSYSVFERWSFFFLNEPIVGHTFPPFSATMAWLVDGITIGATLLTVLGTVLFGRRALAVSDKLHHVLGALFILHGICLFLQMSASIAHNQTAASQLVLITVFASVAKYAGCALVFFRAARIGSAFPTLSA